MWLPAFPGVCVRAAVGGWGRLASPRDLDCVGFLSCWRHEALGGAGWAPEAAPGDLREQLGFGGRGGQGQGVRAVTPGATGGGFGAFLSAPSAVEAREGDGVLEGCQQLKIETGVTRLRSLWLKPRLGARGAARLARRPGGRWALPLEQQEEGRPG